MERKLPTQASSKAKRAQPHGGYSGDRVDRVAHGKSSFSFTVEQERRYHATGLACRV